jgi:DNA-binding CsgD family transcriptional regulator
MELQADSPPSPISAEQLGAMLLDLYPLANGPNASPAGDRLLAWLGGHIAFDAVWFGRSTIEDGLITPHDSLTSGLVSDFVTDWRRLRRIDPLAATVVRQPGHGIAMTTNELPRRSSVRAFGEDHRLAGVLAILMRVPDSPWCTHLSLYRRQPAAYDAHDLTLLQLLMPHLISVMSLRTPRDTALAPLSPREAEVARLFGRGLSYKAVARALDASPATVRHHLRQAYAKLGITSKVEMARLVLGQAAEL